MKRAIILLWCVWLTGGCIMDLHDLRATEPAWTKPVHGQYAHLANCVAEGLQASERGTWSFKPGDLIYQVIDRTDERRATVTGYFPNAPYVAPMLDFTFRQQGAETIVESRWGRTKGSDLDSVPGTKRVDERARPIIEGCAERQ